MNNPDPANPSATAAAPAFNREAVMRMLRDDIASGSSGIELTDLGVGTATVTMRIRDDMVNGHAIGHGGFVFLLADTAFACACNSYGPVTVAADAYITFIKPVRAGDVLTAKAVEKAKFGRNGVYDITISGADGVVAEFRGRSRTIGR